MNWDDLSDKQKEEIDRYMKLSGNDALEMAAMLVEGFDDVVRKPTSFKETADLIRQLKHPIT